MVTQNYSITIAERNHQIRLIKINMDFLEKRIKEQRAELDHIERVDEGLLWQNIQMDLAPPIPEAKVVQSNRFLKMYAVAASVALLMMASWVFYNKQNTVEVATTDDPEPRNFVPQFEEEIGYRQTVAETKEEIDFKNIDKRKYEEIFYELEMLETIHNEFREDLSTMADKDRAVNVLQKYYERKIRILERLSREIEKKSQYEKRINEKPSM